MNADELKALRLQLKLTQAELAGKLYISRDAVAKLESGKNNMSKPVEALAIQLHNSLANQGRHP